LAFSPQIFASQGFWQTPSIHFLSFEHSEFSAQDFPSLQLSKGFPFHPRRQAQILWPSVTKQSAFLPQMLTSHATSSLESLEIEQLEFHAEF
jgi:hypothetical protein